MKSLSLALFLTILVQTAFAQTEAETLKQANDLISSKKYYSAYQLLDKFDPDNSKPDIVLLKQDIVLNYFVTSMMHQLFALKDLDAHEDIMDYRGSDEGTYSMVMFEPDKILDNLIKTYPDNCKLHKARGDFYYDANLKYGGNWLKTEDELFKLIEADFQKAIEGNCADYMTYYQIGHIELAGKRYSESVPHFLKSIAMDKNYPTAHYNLAYAYMFLDDPQNALVYARNALDLYTDPGYKSDAARMMAQLYMELKDEKNALIYYERADEIDPGSYYNLKPLLNRYVLSDNPKAIETRTAFFGLDPTNPTIYNDLEDIYYYAEKADDLIAFYNEQLSVYKNDDDVSGNLNFFIGKLYLEIDKKQAQEHFMKAKEIFSTIYEKDHQVFQVIEEALKKAEKK